jgi:serine/threonine protein kinase
MSKRYAIKQARKDLSSMNQMDALIALENEMKVLSDLRHPNIIEIQ